MCCFFFFMRKTAYDVRISDWSSDVCSSDLTRLDGQINTQPFTLLPEREVTVATLEGDIQGRPKSKDSPVIDYDARLDGKRSEERRLGKACVSPCRSLWSRHH